MYVENGEIVVLRPEGVWITKSSGEEVERAPETVDWDQETAEKGGFETFMLKEIHEQADAVAETIADRTARVAMASTSTRRERSTRRSSRTSAGSWWSPVGPPTTRV